MKLCELRVSFFLSLHLPFFLLLLHFNFFLLSFILWFFFLLQFISVFRWVLFYFLKTPPLSKTPSFSLTLSLSKKPILCGISRLFSNFSFHTPLLFLSPSLISFPVFLPLVLLSLCFLSFCISLYLSSSLFLSVSHCFLVSLSLFISPSRFISPSPFLSLLITCYARRIRMRLLEPGLFTTSTRKEWRGSLGENKEKEKKVSG